MNKDNLKQYRIDNLKQAQATRKQDSLNRVNEAISQLQKRHEKINFRTIASVANVSVSYLYKYPEIKQRIAEIRNEQSSMVRQELKPTVSTSQVKVQARLKERIKGLENENKELRRKNEALAGQVYRVHQLNELIECQQSTIEDLESRLEECSLNNPKLSSKITPISQKRTIKMLESRRQSDSELKTLNISINSTLSKLIDNNPEEVVLNAISSLKEGLSNKTVRNKTGFLVKAIENQWIANDNFEDKVEQNIFNEWFLLANSKGLVSASTNFDGVLHVLTPDDEWVPFEKMISKYPLETLKN